MSGALERILELESAGVVMSRNRHFELFEREENRAALQAWRSVAALRQSLEDHRRLGETKLELTPSDGRYRLVARIDGIAAKLEWRLHAGEIGLLLRNPDVRLWFEWSGVHAPAESTRYMQGPSGAP